MTSFSDLKIATTLMNLWQCAWQPAIDKRRNVCLRVCVCVKPEPNKVIAGSFVLIDYPIKLLCNAL